MPTFIAGLDIGTHTIKAAVAETRRDGRISLRKIARGPSAGMRRGVIHDLGETIRACVAVISEVKRDYPHALKSLYLAHGGEGAATHPSRGIVAVSRADSEIHRDDIERAIEASQAIKLPRNRTVIHSLIQEYIVDEAQHITDPTGMMGNRLEVRSLIIEGFTPAFKDAIRCAEVCGGGVREVMFSPLAASRAALSKAQRELGVCLVDIGAGTCGIAVYDEGKLAHTAILPMGSGHVTNDLAIGLRTTPEAAEHIKRTLGLALAREAPARETVELRKFDPTLRTSATRRFIAEVIEDRCVELFSLVHHELTEIGLGGKLSGGVVLAGGGSKLPGLVSLARQELKVAAQVGMPLLTEFDLPDPELAHIAEDPEMMTVIGLLLSAGDSFKTERPARQTPYWFSSIFKSIFKHFMT